MTTRSIIVGWSVRLTTLLLGFASAFGLYKSIRSVMSSLKVQQQHPGETLGLTLSTISTLIFGAYALVIVAALLSSKLALYRFVAVLTFVFGFMVMVPSLVVGLHYHPDSWSYYLIILVTLFVVSALLFWGAKFVSTKGTLEISND